MATDNRPLSPHLQVYRWQITSVLSILHRITGVGLAVGAIVFAYWLNAAGYGADAFARAQAVLGTWVGVVLLVGWTFALFYHLLNGIRHLFWDAGMGFELGQVRASGWSVVIGAALLTAITWAVVWNMAGGAG